MKNTAVILAAGKGVRMHSRLPKVMHQVAGKPIVIHVIETVNQAGIQDVTVVVGHGKDLVQDALKEYNINFAEQEQQLGTGHALMQAQSQIDPKSTLLVLAGDIPLLTAKTVKDLLEFHHQSQATATVLSAEIKNPYGYGRIVRDKDDSFLRVVEEKDASSKEKKIKEINSGIYCFQAQAVFSALKQISTRNAQGEYYLTDVLEILKQEGKKVGVLLTSAVQDIYGINDRVQLARAETIMRQRKNVALMQSGVTIIDPDSTFIDMQVQIGQDTVIRPFTIIEGPTVIGQECIIGPGTRITASVIGDNVNIENSRIDRAHIDDACTIGPFAYLRPDTVLHRQVKIGDFVEVKKSVIGENSKIPHLSYVGDATLGKKVNVGAGTITCNYDGQNKYPTILEDHVFIGSNTNLVAPVKVGEGAFTGAGSTITRDVPAGALAVERAEQRIIKNWKVKKRD